MLMELLWAIFSSNNQTILITAFLFIFLKQRLKFMYMDMDVSRQIFAYFRKFHIWCPHLCSAYNLLYHPSPVSVCRWVLWKITASLKGKETIFLEMKWIKNSRFLRDKPDVVAHACNPSRYLGGQVRRIALSSRLAWPTMRDPVPENNPNPKTWQKNKNVAVRF